MASALAHTPRTVLLCGPYLSGKTSLFEALLAEAGVLQPHEGQAGFAIADSTPEAKSFEMSTEMNVATADYLGETWTFIDCPGSLELIHETRAALDIADLAVIVTEPDPAKMVTLDPFVKLIEAAGLPHIVFINKFDKRDVSARELMEAMQGISAKPLVLREIPIREGEQVTGFVDLVSERAFHWEEGKPSSLMKLPADVADREEAARTELLEHLADFDDGLLEQLLEDVEPSRDEIYANMAQDLSANLVVPVFFGSATHRHGIHRLMKALRHEGPEIAATDARLGIDPDGAVSVRVFKTYQAGHAGKMSIARVLSGTLKAGDTLAGARPAGVHRLFGRKTEAMQEARAGEVVGLTKLEDAQTGDLLTAEGRTPSRPEALAPQYALAIHAAKRSDDVKLSDQVKRLVEEDPSLAAEFDEASGGQVLHGQGEMHLRLALERLRTRAGIEVETAMPVVAHRQSVRKTVETRVRHKKQSGGHGEFGEVHIRLAPLSRGEGFRFDQQIHGGSVPKQYFSAIENGVQDAMAKGPLGHPVVDVAVTLLDGKTHSVDSSEMAFRKAAAQAMRDALAEAGSVALEPICHVQVHTPEAFIAGVQKIVLGRRGQIFGFETREGWPGWNTVECQIPAEDMQDLIVELRSVTMGVASYASRFDHMQEVHG